VGHDSIHMWDMVYLSIYMTHFICGAWYTHIMDVARFICATSIHMWNIYLYVQRLFICGTSIYMWNIYLYVEHLFICGTSIYMWNIYLYVHCLAWQNHLHRHLYVGHDSIHMCDMVYQSIYMTHFICGAWYEHIMDVARCLCAPSINMCNICMWDMTRFICGIWYINQCTWRISSVERDMNI